MQLSELLSQIQTVHIVGNTHIEITGIQSDSRKVESGNIFVAQRGTTVDGHTFIQQCIEKGATAVVMDNPEYMPLSAENEVA